MGTKHDYNWLDDPFDDEKNAEYLREAKHSRNMGYLIGGVIIAFVVLVAIFGVAIFSTMM